MRVIYGDELFLENALIDYLLLLATSRITGVPGGRARMALAALFGGAYSLLALYGKFGFLNTAAFKLAAGILMTLAVFGGSRRFFRVCLVFFAVSAAFAGMAMAAQTAGGTFLSATFRTLALSFGACWAAFSAAFRRLAAHRVKGDVAALTVALGGKRITVRALADDGNGLADPLTGRAVTVCGLAAVEPLFDGETRSVLRLYRSDPAGALRVLGGVRKGTPFLLLPYSSVGVKSGLLLAFRADFVSVGKRTQKNALVAIAPEGAPEGDGYSALTGAM